MLSVVCAFSVSILLGVSLSDVYYAVMYDLTVCVIVFMVIDTFILWVKQEKIDINIGNGEIDKKKCDGELIFKESLLKGNLGSIKEGEKNNE